jgi:hypothetical protein
MNRLIAIAAATLLAGCAVYTEGSEVSFGKPIPANLSSNLTASEVAWSKARGSNTITGQAILRTRGGDVKSCAGLEAPSPTALAKRASEAESGARSRRTRPPITTQSAARSAMRRATSGSATCRMVGTSCSSKCPGMPSRADTTRT